MQGIHIINDPNGEPAVLTIDLHNLDPDVSPLVAGLLDRLNNQTEEQERADWRAAAHAALNRAYGDVELNYSDAERRDFLYASGALANRAYDDDEPEYTDANLIERNPNYQPK